MLADGVTDESLSLLKQDEEQAMDMTTAKLPEAPIPDTHVGILETALLATVSTISHKDGLISTNPVGFDWDGEHVRLSTLKQGPQNGRPA